jgi:hypothetical protein
MAKIEVKKLDKIIKAISSNFRMMLISKNPQIRMIKYNMTIFNEQRQNNHL